MHCVNGSALAIAAAMLLPGANVAQGQMNSARAVAGGGIFGEG